MPPIFMTFVTEIPPIFLPCMHVVEGNVQCFVKHGRNLENVVFLKQNPEIW